MLVALQFAGVPPVPLNVTVLALCVGPKFSPVIVSDAPIVSETAEMLAMLGCCKTVNGSALLAIPPAVTTRFPVVAPFGTGTEILDALQFVGIPAVPLNAAVLAPCAAPKLMPVIVTDVPTVPDVRDKLSTIGDCDTVNSTALLASPPTVTTTFPEVAPLGTGTTIRVALQYVAVPVVPLNVTVPGLVPKLSPAIVTSAVGTAAFGDKLATEGARTGALKLTVTLSKAAVDREVLPLFSIRPTYTFGAMLTVWFPTRVQFTPSGEMELLKVVPLRTNWTQ
jgi:hypothetical protein